MFSVLCRTWKGISCRSRPPGSGLASSSRRVGVSGAAAAGGAGAVGDPKMVCGSAVPPRWVPARGCSRKIDLRSGLSLLLFDTFDTADYLLDEAAVGPCSTRCGCVVIEWRLDSVSLAHFHVQRDERLKELLSEIGLDLFQVTLRVVGER